MAPRTATDKATEISVISIKQGLIHCCIVGTTPIILNRMSIKAFQELLLPHGKKNAAEKAGSLKHDPMAEFQASPYRSTDPESPTLLVHLSTAFKGSMRGAALDLPGASKAQIGRLVYIEGEYVPIWGIPQMFMSVVRNSDMNHTPDIRTRVIVPQWATRLRIRHTLPLVPEKVVANLLAAAGVIQGVGDFRPEKGKGSFGQFEMVNADDKRFVSITKNGGRAAQEKAMANPGFYDQETEEMFSWFTQEVEKRGLRKVA
jgi:hypothetical protein